MTNMTNIINPKDARVITNNNNDKLPKVSFNTRQPSTYKFDIVTPDNIEVYFPNYKKIITDNITAVADSGQFETEIPFHKCNIGGNIRYDQLGDVIAKELHDMGYESHYSFCQDVLFISWYEGHVVPKMFSII